MIDKTRLAPYAAALLLPLALFPFVLHPYYGIGLVVLVVLVALSTRSVAWPVVLSGVPVIVIGALGRDPFPNRSIALGTFAWIVLALIVFSMREGAFPLASVLNAPTLATLALGALLIVRLGSSLDPAYGKFKVQLFVAENLALLLAGILIGSRRRDFSLLLVGLLVIAGVTAIVLARGLSTGSLATNVGGRFTLDTNGSPIGLGRAAAQGILIATFLVISKAKHVGVRLLALALLPLIAVSFIAAGSRGPVLGLVVGLVVLLGLMLRESGARYRVLLVALAGVVGAVLVTQLVPGQDVQRSISVLTGSGNGLSSNGRNDLWSVAWNLFVAHPLQGSGTGSYAFYERIDLFPHNLFLELGAEVGILGVLLAATVIGGAALALVRTYRVAPAEHNDVALAAALLVAAFVNAMFSSDVAGNATLWLAAGLCVGLQRRVAVARAGADPLLARLRPRRGKPCP